MLMPSILEKTYLMTFSPLNGPQKQYEKEVSCDLDENGYPGVRRAALSWISTCRDAKRRISRQN